MVPEEEVRLCIYFVPYAHSLMQGMPQMICTPLKLYSWHDRYHLHVRAWLHQVS